MVVAQANDPARSIADVAQEHGLNANMIARWRRSISAQDASSVEARHQPIFIPITVPKPDSPSGGIVVEYGEITIRLESPVSEATLRTIFVLLRERS